MGLMQMLGINQTAYGEGGLSKRVIGKVNDAYLPDEHDGAAVAGGYEQDSLKPGAQDHFLSSRAAQHSKDNEHFRQQAELKALYRR